MSFTQPDQVSRPPNLSSNNPFRNRAASPSFPPAQRSPLDPPPRPVSRNPFLDSASTNAVPAPSASPDKMSFATDTKAAPRSAMTGNAADLFDNLTLDDKQAPSNGMRPSGTSRSNTGGAAPPPYSSSSRQGENVHPRAASGHRPSRSQEEAMRARRIAASSGSRSRPAGELDIFADPSESPKKSDSRRVRRNSESSVVGRKLLDPEEEKKKQERRRRERRHRDREGSSSKSKKPDRKLDVIDKLDVTSIYGTGLFHHDGPFDACNPHRNRNGSKRAPMQAFPKDSLNNVMGGGGPLNKRPDHAAFLGRNDEEAFKDYSKGGNTMNGFEPYNNGAMRPVKPAANIESATSKVEPIHGDETAGLGTSTFLEGAPASKTAMQRELASPGEGGGLSRKKSLAQKIRGINNRRDYGPSGRMTSPEGVSVSPEAPAYTPGGSRVAETNPFFNEYGRKDEPKKESVTFVEPVRQPGRARAPSSPGRGYNLERRVTSDGSSGADGPSKSNGGGFLSRVKSLKGGPRKPRAEKPLPPLQTVDY